MQVPVLRALPIVAVLGALAAAPSALAGRRDATPQKSSNWAGYAVSDATTVSAGAPDPTQTPPLQFTDVTGTFRVPQVLCTAGRPAYSAFWVGLGGFATTSQALEQVGVDADCSAAGTAVYYAWYEVVPAPAQQVTLRVRAGDTVTTSVVVNGTDVLVQVKNRTRGVSFTRHVTVAAPDVGSAEWIAEAPSACSQDGNACHVLPLANFGTVGFTNLAATANAHGGTLLDPFWSAAQISLVPGAHHGLPTQPPGNAGAGAAPAAPTPDGRSFTVGYRPSAV